MRLGIRSILSLFSDAAIVSAVMRALFPSSRMDDPRCISCSSLVPHQSLPIMRFEAPCGMRGCSSCSWWFNVARADSYTFMRCTQSCTIEVPSFQDTGTRSPRKSEDLYDSQILYDARTPGFLQGPRDLSSISRNAFSADCRKHETQTSGISCGICCI